MLAKGTARKGVVAYLKGAAVVLLAITLWPANARADGVMIDGRLVPARVLSFNRTTVSYLEGCSGGTSHVVTWKDIDGLTFDKECSEAPRVATTVGGEACASENFGFFVTMRAIRAPLVAENLQLDQQGQLHLDLFEPWEQAHGPLTEVAEIRRRQICGSLHKDDTQFPNSYCHEPRQVGVAFDYATPLNNRILANGFSFVLRTSGNIPPGFDLERFAGDVRQSFGTGVLMWVAALSDRPAMLTPAVQRFIDSRTSSSPRFRLLTPPQVIRVKCSQAAVFAVELHFGEGPLFPSFPVVIARARIEGRTLAINMRPFKCFGYDIRVDENRQLPFTTADGCINLVPVMTHELGHAFGLRHADSPSVPALMDSTFSRTALSPTDSDVRALVAVLERSIVGAGPGVLRFQEADGVRPPKD